MIVVVCGVSGVGKTTVGKALAAKLRAEFADADDYHSQTNVAKMARGESLDDADREPWLRALRAAIEKWLESGVDVVLACSALKDAYRAQLSHGDARVRFALLEAPPEVIRERLERRHGHFAGPALLDAQLRALEHPDGALVVDATKTVDDQVAAITAWALDT